MLILDTPSKRLKAFIELHFKSVSDFTRAMGISRQYVRIYLNGDSDAVFKKAKHINDLKKLGLNIDWYLTGEGEMLLQNAKGANDNLFDNLKSNVREGDPAVMDEIRVKPPCFRAFSGAC